MSILLDKMVPLTLNGEIGYELAESNVHPNVGSAAAEANIRKSELNTDEFFRVHEHNHDIGNVRPCLILEVINPV